jgi:hypothetical protein
LIQFLKAVTRAKADDESRRIAEIDKVGCGGQTLEERSRERFNKDGKVTSRFTSKRYAPADWKAHAWLLERRNAKQWGRRRESRIARITRVLQCPATDQRLRHVVPPTDRSLPALTPTDRGLVVLRSSRMIAAHGRSTTTAVVNGPTAKRRACARRRKPVSRAGRDRES